MLLVRLVHYEMIEVDLQLRPVMIPTDLQKQRRKIPGKKGGKKMEKCYPKANVTLTFLSKSKLIGIRLYIDMSVLKHTQTILLLLM